MESIATLTSRWARIVALSWRDFLSSLAVRKETAENILENENGSDRILN